MSARSGPGPTRQEEKVLAAVGRRLTNPEIAAQLSISIRTVESHIAALRRKLGARNRAELIAAAEGHRAAVVRIPANSFVGRERELAQLRDFLDAHRFVTLVGPAGSGKTRLALELAASDTRTPIVVELEHAAPDEVARAVATAVGLGTDSAGSPVAACATALEGRRSLLLLDNCDRVTTAAAGLVRDLLAPVAGLTVLATSRTPLGGADEALFPVGPLPVEDAARRLFLDRVTAVRGAGSADPAVVARICRRLDGLPLALELAAARTRHLSPAELAERLDQGFDALERGGPAHRHQTLETAFAWTWDLLDPDERATLGALAALPGPFDLMLADAVLGAGRAGVVLRLLDRSLLSPAAEDAGATRYRLLDAVRAFVLARTDPALASRARAAHAHHFADAAGALAATARTDDRPAAADAARRLAPGAVAALDWALTHDPAAAARLATALAILAEQYGPQLNTLDAITRAARTPAVREAASGEQLHTIGIALCFGDLTSADSLAGYLLARSDDPLAAHQLAGWADAYQHRVQPALAHLRAAQALTTDVWQLAEAHQGQGIAQRASDPAAALASFERSMEQYARAGDAMHVNNVRFMMARTAVAAGRPTTQAVAWAEQCAEYAAGTGNVHELAHARLARADLVAGTDLAETLAVLRTIGDLRCLCRGYLLTAAAQPLAQRPASLWTALQVAGRAHDEAHQRQALERLVDVHWELGQARPAFTALGRLGALVGEQAALDSTPAAMRAVLPTWAGAVAEGRASAD